MHRTLGCVMLWLLSAPAAAQTLYKCTSADGGVGYQSMPCAAGATTAWTREVEPEAAPPAAAAPPARAPRTTPPRSDRARAAARPGPNPSQQARARCAQAREHARQQRDRLWNRLTFEQRSALDAEVARACGR